MTGVIMVMGGVAPHITLVRARPPSLGAICVASLRVGAGSLVPRGPVGAGFWGGGAGRAPAPLSDGGRGDHPPCFGRRGPGPPRLAGHWGGLGGRRAAASLLPLLVAARGSLPLPPSCRQRTPPRRARWVGVARPPLEGARMRGGPWTAPPGASSDLKPPPALPERAMVMGGSWGARPPYCSGAAPCAAPRLGPRTAPARWCELARRPRPPRAQAAGGAGARGVQVQPYPPPPRRGPFWGRGGVPSAPGGRRVAAAALKLGGGSGGGVGGPPHHPRPLVSSGVGVPSVVSGVPPLGYTRAVGVAGWPRASGAARSAANVAVRRGGGGGEGNPPALVRAPVFPRPASEGATPFAPSWAPPVRRRPAAGRAGACGLFTGGVCCCCGAPSPEVQRPLRGGAGPPSSRSASVRFWA